MYDENLLGELREACGRAVAKLGGADGAAAARYKAAALEKLGLLGCVAMDQFPVMVRHILWAYDREVPDGMEPDLFTLCLLRAMQKATVEQLGRLAESYPGYAALEWLMRQQDPRLQLLVRDAAAQAAR